MYKYVYPRALRATPPPCLTKTKSKTEREREKEKEKEEQEEKEGEKEKGKETEKATPGTLFGCPWGAPNLTFGSSWVPL